MTAQERYEACTDALRHFARNAGFSDVVLGLSGGMDSALVACMCVDAFGAEHVHGVMLPGPYSSSASVEDAREEADNLGIHVETISIAQPFEPFELRARNGEVNRHAQITRPAPELERIPPERTPIRIRAFKNALAHHAFGRPLREGFKPQVLRIVFAVFTGRTLRVDRLEQFINLCCHKQLEGVAPPSGLAAGKRRFNRSRIACASERKPGSTAACAGKAGGIPQKNNMTCPAASEPEEFHRPFHGFEDFRPRPDLRLSQACHKKGRPPRERTALFFSFNEAQCLSNFTSTPFMEVSTAGRLR